MRLAGDDDDILFIYLINYLCMYVCMYVCIIIIVIVIIVNKAILRSVYAVLDLDLDSYVAETSIGHFCNGTVNYQFLRLSGWEWKLRKRVGEGGGGKYVCVCGEERGGKVDASCVLLSLITLYVHSSVFNNAEHAFCSL